MKNYLLILFTIFSFFAKAQNIGINATGVVPNSSAMLDISSTTLGLLIPRMTYAQRTAAGLNPLPAIAQGLLVYQTNTSGTFLEGFYYNSSLTTTPTWNYISSSVGWSLTGNAGTSEATNFVGTTDVHALVFKVNSIMGGRIGVSGTDNTNFGYNSLLNGSAGGSSNSAVGANSQQNVSSGTYNSTIGASSLKTNTTGSYNTATGASSLQLNSTGGYNTANGVFSLFNNTGNNNTGSGAYSLFSNIGGYSNTANGISSLYKNTGGNRNTAIGDSAMYSNLTGNNNVASGYYSLYNNTTGYNNSAFGFSALLTNNLGGYRNTAIGDSAIYANTSGYNNAALGVLALGKNTTGYNNSAVGVNALYSNLGGQYNTAIGSTSLYSNTSGQANSAVGVGALYGNNTASFNTAIGSYSLFTNNGQGNTGTGYNALTANSTGTYNTASGAQSLFANDIGGYNSAYGYEALYSNTSGTYNVAVGAYSGYNFTTPANSSITGSYNVFIGPYATSNNSNLTNAIAIGKNATVNISNAMVLGGTGGDKVFVGIGTSSPAAELDVCGSGRITGTFNVGGVLSSSTGIACSSDKRYKKNILPLNNALKDILKLQGVTYNWRKDEFPDKGFTDNTQIGFIAQDIEKIFPQMVFTDDKGYKSVDYSRLTPVLVEALKAQQKIIDTQNQSIDELKAEVKDIQALLKYNGLVKPFSINTASVSAEKK